MERGGGSTLHIGPWWAKILFVKYDFHLMLLIFAHGWPKHQMDNKVGGERHCLQYYNGCPSNFIVRAESSNAVAIKVRLRSISKLQMMHFDTACNNGWNEWRRSAYLHLTHTHTFTHEQTQSHTHTHTPVCPLVLKRGSAWPFQRSKNDPF